MTLSAAQCRSEQARHLKMSLDDPLLSRRAISLKAAAAWGLEAARADLREAKGSAILSSEDAEFARQFAEEAAISTDSQSDD